MKYLILLAFFLLAFYQMLFSFEISNTTPMRLHYRIQPIGALGSYGGEIPAWGYLHLDANSFFPTCGDQEQFKIDFWGENGRPSGNIFSDSKIMTAAEVRKLSYIFMVRMDHEFILIKPLKDEQRLKALAGMI
jgi:hypothetical protein